MAKDVLLLDMDGPIAHFDQAFFNLCDEQQVVLNCTLETQVHRFGTDHIEDKKLRSKMRRHIYETRWFLDLPVVEGAQEGVRRLQEHFDVWLCTKPLEENKNCRDDKAAWVERHFGRNLVNQLIITPDKTKVVGVALLDDAIKIDWIGKGVWQPVIYRTPWNQQGSVWENLPHWDWNDDIDDLKEIIYGSIHG